MAKQGTQSPREWGEQGGELSKLGSPTGQRGKVPIPTVGNNLRVSPFQRSI